MIRDYSRKITWLAIAADRKGRRPFLHAEDPKGGGRALGRDGAPGAEAPRSSGVLWINNTQFDLKTVSKLIFNYNKIRLQDTYSDLPFISPLSKSSEWHLIQ